MFLLDFNNSTISQLTISMFKALRVVHNTFHNILYILLEYSVYCVSVYILGSDFCFKPYGIGGGAGRFQSWPVFQ